MTDYTSMANGGLPRISPYQAGKPIEEVQRELGLSEVIKLASNENPFGMSKKAVAKCAEALNSSHVYPDSNGYYLKQKLFEKFGYYPKTITLGDGSNELINLIFQTFINNKVNVVIPAYSFVVYPMEATVADAQVKTIPLKDWVIDLDAVYDAIDSNTRMVVLANPANPTGTAVNIKKLKEFVKKVSHETLVVIDEAYNEYQKEEDFDDTAKWIKECPNLIVSRTFSKAYGLAGLRIGYMVSNEEIASLVNRLRAPFNVNAIALTAAIEALDDTDHLKMVVAENAKERDRYVKYCEDHNLYMIPSQANFVSIDFKRDAFPIYDALLHRGVIVRPLKGYKLDTILRISIGTHDENTKLFKALDEILKSLK